VKRVALMIGVVVALMLEIASSASAAPPSPPNCFGQTAASIATSGPGAVSDFVHSLLAQTNPPDVTGGDVVAQLKAGC
jgi:hypothetical protein